MSKRADQAGVSIIHVETREYPGQHGAVNVGATPEGLAQLEERVQGRRVRQVEPGVYVVWTRP